MSVTIFKNMVSGATFSKCRKYRWTLWRLEDGCEPHQLCVWLGLNPSTADEKLDDPTIRRCMRFTRDWGFKGYLMLNIFAYRATDPKVMKKQSDPIGEFNDDAIMSMTNNSGLNVAAWGTHGEFMDRGMNVRNMLATRNLHHLGLTKHGHPKHPLYLRADSKPILWT